MHQQRLHLQTTIIDRVHYTLTEKICDGQTLCVQVTFVRIHLCQIARSCSNTVGLSTPPKLPWVYMPDVRVFRIDSHCP